jgi:hypothetical protein
VSLDGVFCLAGPLSFLAPVLRLLNALALCHLLMCCSSSDFVVGLQIVFAVLDSFHFSLNFGISL